MKKKSIESPTVLAHKKAKRKKRITIITAVSSLVVVAFMVIAFLSTYVGNYTIRIRNSSDTKLAISSGLSAATAGANKRTLANPTTYLKSSGLDTAIPDSVIELDENNELQSIDNDDDTPVEGTSHPFTVEIPNDKGVIYSYQRVYYTRFYLTNTRNDSIAYYRYSVSLTGERAGSDGRKLSDSLRIRVYANDISTDDHEYYDYTKKNSVTSDEVEDGTNDKYQTYLRDYCENDPHCIYFTDGDSVISSEVRQLNYDQIIRFSVFMWIEGNDPDCNAEYPDIASLRLSFVVSGAINESQL